MFNKYQYHLLLHIIVFVWGFTGILGKLIHIDAYHIVWHRTWIAVAGVVVFLLFTKRNITLPTRKASLKAAGVGLIVALHWMTFYKSIELSTASLGILCLSTTTLHVTWLEPLLFKKKFSVTEFLLGLIVIYGIYYASDDFSLNDYDALIYGLFSAFFAALFSILNSKLVQETSSYQLTVYELGAGFLFVTVWLLFSGDLDSSIFVMTGTDFLLLLFLGLVCTSLAFILSLEVVKRLGAFTTALTINLEPVYTILLAVVILNEDAVLNNSFYVGSVIIIAVIFINSLLKTRTA
jgi:drug/metabolite transporter (DMT)-like permease